MYAHTYMRISCPGLYNPDKEENRKEPANTASDSGNRCNILN